MHRTAASGKRQPGSQPCTQTVDLFRERTGLVRELKLGVNQILSTILVTLVKMSLDYIPRLHRGMILTLSSHVSHHIQTLNQQLEEHFCKRLMGWWHTAIKHNCHLKLFKDNQK